MSNQMFVAGLLFIIPEEKILARPASTVRSGDGRWVARSLAGLGVSILRKVRGAGTFEGVDAAWLDQHTALVGHGLLTRADVVRQVSAVR